MVSVPRCALKGYQPGIRPSSAGLQIVKELFVCKASWPTGRVKCRAQICQGLRLVRRPVPPCRTFELPCSTLEEQVRSTPSHVLIRITSHESLARLTRQPTAASSGVAPLASRGPGTAPCEHPHIAQARICEGPTQNVKFMRNVRK